MGTDSHLRRRPLIAAVALTGGLTLVGCAVHKATTSTGLPASIRLVAYDDCGGLLKGLRTATEKNVESLGGGMMHPLTGNRLPGDVAAPQRATPDQHSTTNAQEAGVDEPDQVKTDGRRLITYSQGTLRVVDAASQKITGSVRLGQGGGNLLLSGDRVLVITQPMIMFRDAPYNPNPKLTLVDISAAPRVLSTMTLHGSYVDARQVGSTARLVMRSVPDIKLPGRDLAANRKIVARTPLSAWLPRYEVTENGRSQTRTVPCGNVSHPPSYTGTSMLSVFNVDLTKGFGTPPVSLTAGGQTVYGSGSNLYVADQQDQRTNIYAFDKNTKFMAAGTVPGNILSQYSLSEYAGRLRVATTQGQSSTVYVLRRDGRRLSTVGSVSGLGKGERVYAVRFFGPVGYVVTFRQMDPLYTLDLRDKPRATGELKITGYSAYLHPAGDGRLIGVGQEADAKGKPLGTQVSLFDVSDPASPRKINGYRTKGAALTDNDAHAFLYWPATGLTVVPNTTGALVLSVTPTGIKKLGTITPGKNGLIERTTLIGNTLWTLSPDGLQANDVTTLHRTARVPFS